MPTIPTNLSDEDARRLDELAARAGEPPAALAGRWLRERLAGEHDGGEGQPAGRRTVRVELPYRQVAVLAGAAGVLWLAVQLWQVVLLVAVSLMFTAALLPVVEWLVRHGAPRIAAVILLFLVLLAALGLLGLLIVPVAYDQAATLVDELPDLRTRAVRFLNDRNATALARELSDFRPADLIRPGLLASTGRRIFGVLTTALTILVLTAYLLLDAPRLRKALYAVIPARHHKQTSELLHQLQHVVGGYIRGQATTSSCAAAFTFTVLLALGIPNALALGVFAAFADMVPVIGIVLLIGPAALAALSVSVPKAIIVAVLLVAYVQFENQVLVQWVFGAALGLPAAAVLIALLAGSQLLGVAGALLSLPAAATVRVLATYAYQSYKGRSTAPLS